MNTLWAASISAMICAAVAIAASPAVGADHDPGQSPAPHHPQSADPGRDTDPADFVPALSPAPNAFNIPVPIDPVSFFEQLVERYRTLGAYADHTRVVEVTTPAGGEAQRRETQLQCEITPKGELRVSTPGAALLSDLGLSLPFTLSDPMLRSRLAFDLWQAPHLGLRFRDDPLRDFRDGVDDGFTAARARPVRVGARDLVQLELEANADHDDADQDGPAQFDLYIDPQSMLVERIEGRERLPDGASYETTLEIQPREVRDYDGEMITRAVDADVQDDDVASADDWPSEPPASSDSEHDDAPAGAASPQSPSSSSSSSGEPAGSPSLEPVEKTEAPADPEPDDDPAPAPPTMHAPNRSP